VVELLSPGQRARMTAPLPGPSLLVQRVAKVLAKRWKNPCYTHQHLDEVAFLLVGSARTDTDDRSILNTELKNNDSPRLVGKKLWEKSLVGLRLEGTCLGCS
jgi:hypothetical protein